MIWHDSTYSPQATMLCWLDQSDKKAFLRRLWPPVDIQLWLHCYGCYVSYAWLQQLKSLIPRTLTQGRPSIFRHASSQILDSQTLEIRVPEVWFSDSLLPPKSLCLLLGIPPRSSQSVSRNVGMILLTTPNHCSWAAVGWLCSFPASQLYRGRKIR